MTSRARRIRWPLLIVAALACGASLGGASIATATSYQAVRIESPNPQAQGRFGERSAVAGDIDGDGVPDFWVSAFQENVGAATKAGRVYLISGRTRQVIYSVTSPEPQSNQAFGFTLAAIGDVNHDGKTDFAVGAYAHTDGAFQHTGKVWVYSGATGALLYSIANPQLQSNPDLPFSKVFGFGTAISTAGDINGDGIPDILVGAASNDVPTGCGGTSPPTTIPPAPCRRGQGQAFVFSGADGTLLRTYDLPPGDVRPSPDCNRDVPGPGIGTCGFFGQSVQLVGDINGDGVPDHLVQGGTYFGGTYTPGSPGDKEGQIWVFSGRTGQLLLTIPNPSPVRSGGSTRIFGLQIVAPGSPGDVNGDGKADIYGNCFSCAGPTGTAGEGRAWIFSGADGSILANLFDPSPEPAGGFAFSAAGQARGDGFIVGQNGSGNVSGGGATLFGVPDAFGPTANAPALQDFQPPLADRQPSSPTNQGMRFGRTVEAPGDLNGDCIPDYVIGASQTDVGGNSAQGRVYVELSTGPSRCPVPPGTTPPGTTPPGTTPPGTTPPGVKPPVLLPRANLPGLRLSGRRRVRGRRTVFVIRGLLRLPPSVPASRRASVCHGLVTVAVRRGHKTGASRTVRLRRDCSFSATISVPTRRLGRKGRYNIRVRFHGNADLNARFQTANIR